MSKIVPLISVFFDGVTDTALEDMDPATICGFPGDYRDVASQLRFPQSQGNRTGTRFQQYFSKLQLVTCRSRFLFKRFPFR